jgi:4a-hydroxytetrahydrobiopterin dehydratase
MADTRLADRECRPCKGDEPPLEGKALEELAKDLEEGWDVVEEHHLEKEYALEDFREALDFTNAVGEIAEKEDHHPDIELGWGRVQLNLRTHKIDGLTENDFILAAKADRAFDEMKSG